MIKICEKQYDASTVVQVVHENIVPIQPVESGFDVQDSIRKDPLQIVVEVIIFEEGGTLHGQWGCERIDGRMVCDELTGVAPDVGTYKYLVELRDNREIFLLDCSDYARDAAMIYPDMAITQIGQRVQRGGTYRCVVMFTQITKHFIATTDLYVHEYDIDGVAHIRWSKEPIEPSNVETAEEVDISENPPIVNCRTRPSDEKVTSKNALEDIWNWASGVVEGADGCLLFLIEP